MPSRMLACDHRMAFRPSAPGDSMTAAFNFHCPTEIEYGEGSLSTLPRLVARFHARHVLVVGDPGLVKAGLVQQVQDVLAAADVPHTVFTDLKSDPEVRSVVAGTALAKSVSADLVVAIGGGSAMDTAKGIGLM
ncbi:MAG: iron-containing alcohol dehydrogenase, partial [Comamonadaceae bacterium]